MRPGSDEIDQPLGQNRSRGKPRLRIGSVVFGFCALLVVTGSTAIALRDRPFRDLEQSPTPELQTADAPTSGLASASPNRARNNSSSGAGPSVTRVIPEGRPPDQDSLLIRDPTVLTQNPRLAHMPDQALIENTDLGPLPIRDAAGRRPVDVYARPWSGVGGARIAIVIGGLGISQTGTQAAIAKLPSEITLAFAPQGNSLHRWMQEARREGHEIILQVPLEPFGYPQNNPGPHTLLVDAPADKNVENLHWALARVTNYTGVMNYMGARFTADESATSQLMDELGERGLLYFDDGTSARSKTKEIAKEKSVPFAVSDTVIDTEPERGRILEKLGDLERIARARGFAVGSGSALDVTVDTVAAWVGEARRRGIEVIPASAAAFDPERN